MTLKAGPRLAKKYGSARLFSSTSATSSYSVARPLTIALGSSLLAVGLYFNSAHNESPPTLYNSNDTPSNGIPRKVPAITETSAPSLTVQQREYSKTHPGVYFWGSNLFAIADPEKPSEKILKSPQRFGFFNGVVLRQLLIAEDHVAAIDAKGDVYQWGSRFFGDTPASVDSWATAANTASSHVTLAVSPSLLSETVTIKTPPPRKPVKTLVGKDIVQIGISASNLVALTRDGKVFVLEDNYKSLQEKNLLKTEKEEEVVNRSRGWFRGMNMDGIRVVKLPSYASSEKVTSVAAGSHHLALITASGKCFTAPLSAQKGNAFGQLGTGTTEMPKTNSQKELHCVIPRLPENIKASQVVCGEAHTLVRTGEGRVFAFGSNNYGQCATGDYNTTTLAYPNPTEITSLVTNKANSTDAKVVKVAANGNVSGFVVERTELVKTEEDQSGKRMAQIELYMAGSGQVGQMGSGQYYHVQPNPTKVRALSNLSEYNEKSKSLVPISLYNVSLSPSHCAAILENSNPPTDIDGIIYGRDVYMWGCGLDYQLGTGKKGNVAVPVPPGTLLTGNVDEDGRLQVHGKSEIQWEKDGKKMKAIVEQDVALGWGITAVYSKICEY